MKRDDYTSPLPARVTLMAKMDAYECVVQLRHRCTTISIFKKILYLMAETLRINKVKIIFRYSWWQTTFSKKVEGLIAEPYSFGG